MARYAVKIGYADDEEAKWLGEGVFEGGDRSAAIKAAMDAFWDDRLDGASCRAVVRARKIPTHRPNGREATKESR